MLAWGFFEIENIRSFDCSPSLAMKAVMANFSPRISTFSDSVLIFELMTSGFLESSILWSECDN